MEDRRSEYMKFYCDQAGSGLPVYRGARFMHGHGFLGRMAKRVAIPLFRFLGKHLANTGLDIASDVIAGRSKLKEAVKSNFRHNNQVMAEQIIPLLKNRIATGSMQLLDHSDQQALMDAQESPQEGSGARGRGRSKSQTLKEKKAQAKRRKALANNKTTKNQGQIQAMSVRGRKSLASDLSSRTLKKYPFFQL